MICVAPEEVPPQDPDICPTPLKDKELQSEAEVPRFTSVPEAMERSPEIWFELVKVFVPPPLKVSLLKVVADAEIFWLPEAIKFTLPVPGLKREPLPFQTVGLEPVSARLLEPL